MMKVSFKSSIAWMLLLSPALAGSASAIVPPPQAAQYGYVNRIFYEDWSQGTLTIDVNNTLASGFNWYITGWYGSQNTLSTDISVSGNNLTLMRHLAVGSAPTNYVARLGTIGATGTYTYTGTAFSPGGYYEACFAYNPVSAPSNDPASGWPAAWLNAIVNMQVPATGTNNGVELDIFEAYPTGVGAVSPIMTDHTWQSVNGGALTQTSSSGNNAFTVPSGMGSYAQTDQNCYGLLWVTMAQGGGTGGFYRYFNGVHVSYNDVTYTSGSLYAAGESNLFNLMIDSGAQNSQISTKVVVWH